MDRALIPKLDDNDPSRLGLYHRSLVLLRRLAVSRHRRARADKVAVAVNVVDAPDRRPIFVFAQGMKREERFLLRVRLGPIAFEQEMVGMGRVAQ